MLTVGSLFSGIGGLDLGLERAGMNVIWQSEIDPYATKVLKKHWPQVVNHGDIKQINWRNVVRPDVICGGYPCQPFSLAGKRNGTDDPRHLFPWVLNAISTLRPRYAILENVRGHLTMGGTTVIASLTSIGYDAEWRVVSAAGVGAPHKRERIIIVAYPNDSELGYINKRGINTRTNVKRRKVFVTDSSSDCDTWRLSRCCMVCMLQRIRLLLFRLCLIRLGGLVLLLCCVCTNDTMVGRAVVQRVLVCRSLCRVRLVCVSCSRASLALTRRLRALSSVVVCHVCCRVHVCAFFVC